MMINFGFNKKSLLKFIGITENGNMVFGGIYECYETHGLPLDIIIASIIDKGHIPGFYDCICSMKKKINSKRQQSIIKSKLTTAIMDSMRYNHSQINEIESKIDKCLQG
jgi:hypothetical protein